MKKHIEKTVYLENQSNLRFEGLLKEMKHGMERKRKLRMPSSKNSILNLLQKINMLIAQAALGGKMELQNRDGSFVSLQVIKQKRQFLRGQGESNPKV